MSPKIKKLAIATVIILLLFFGYKFFFVSDNVPSLSSQSISSNNGGDVTLLLNQLRSLRLDTSIFGDQAFATLVDYGVVLDPQPVGRVNPFAPIGQGVRAPQITQEVTDESGAEGQEETPPSEEVGS